MAEQNNLILTGLQPLPFYDIPAQLILQPISPTSDNYSTRPYKNFQIGTFWLNTVDLSLWYLAKILTAPKHEGDWIRISSGAGNIEKLTGNIGGSVGPDNNENINVLGDTTTITISGNPATNTLTASTTGIIATNYPTDSGTAVPAGGTLNIIANNAADNAGSSVLFTGVGNTVLFNVTDSNNNTIIGKISGRAGITGLNNTVFGAATGSSLTSGSQNVLVGNVTGNLLTTGSSNTFVGRNAGPAVTTGATNILIGQSAGTNYTTESNNIIIGTDPGTIAEQGVIRIVVTDNGHDSNVFIGQNVGNDTYTEGTAIRNYAIGSVSFSALTTGSNNTAMGNGSLAAITTGSFNSAFGDTTLNSCTTGSNNNSQGSGALQALTTGSSNSAYGHLAGQKITTGSNNVLIGERSGVIMGSGLVSGVYNILVGDDSGSNYTAAESYNIIIGSHGVNSENNTIRVGGGTGAGARQQNQCFISGIRGITTGNNDAIAVLVDSADQLGTVSSSARYKENIKYMGLESEIIYNLRPVTFNYKKHPNAPAWGLIAEEVEAVFPQLVVFKDDQPESVKYHDLVPLLLNEVIKLRKRIEIMEREE